MEEDLLLLFFILNIMKAFRARNISDLKYLRDNSNPFDMSEAQFIKNFRMPQNVAVRFIEELAVFDTDHYSEIPFYLKVLVSLNFYATGSYQNPVGRNNFLNVSQPSVSRIITYISTLISVHLGEKYIHFPKDANEINEVKREFMETFSIPNTIGCIDCTHIAIICPSHADRERPPRVYRNRKRFYSINVEAVCDAKLRFLWINPKFPGSCHDSGIWAVSPLRKHLRRHADGNWLLGDSGYPIEPWLLTPYEEVTEIYQEKFNDLHITTRNCIERAFGVFKSIFRCMLKQRSLHYSPAKASLIINACFVTYNFLQGEGMVTEFLNDEMDENYIDADNLETGCVSRRDIFVDGTARRETFARSLILDM